MAAYEPSEVIIYVVSDSAGDTGELVVRAAVAQFHPITAISAERRLFMTQRRSSGLSFLRKSIMPLFCTPLSFLIYANGW